MVQVMTTRPHRFLTRTMRVAVTVYLPCVLVLGGSITTAFLLAATSPSRPPPPTCCYRTAFSGVVLTGSHLSAVAKNNKKKKNSNNKSLSRGGGGGFGVAPSSGPTTTTTSSNTLRISGHSGSGVKALRKAANTFDKIRKDNVGNVQACCRDVYVRSPLNSPTTYWFVGKIARQPLPTTTTLPQADCWSI